MSLNLGNDGVAAARALNGSSDFTALRGALKELVRQKMNAALESSPDHRADACGYARALRDMHQAIESAATGVPQQQVKKPGPKE